MSDNRLKRSVSVRKALQYVTDHPEMTTDPIDTPVWELISRILFDIANTPDIRKRGSLARARRAQEIIAVRLVGTRRRGTHPATLSNNAVKLRDLTEGMIEQ